MLLYLVEDELGDDEGPLYEACLAYIRYPPVYDGARIEELDILVLLQAVEQGNLGEVDRFDFSFPRTNPSNP
jgi:hypothetical protein